MVRGRGNENCSSRYHNTGRLCIRLSLEWEHACERSGSGRNFRSPLTPLCVTPAHRSATFPLHRIFSRPAPAPLPLIQFSDPFRSRSTPHRGMSKGGPLMAPKNIVVPVRATGKYRWKVKWAISYRFKSLILCQFLNIMSYNVGMPIWVHRKYFTKSIEKNVFEFEIRKLTAECKCTLTYEISQLL